MKYRVYFYKIMGVLAEYKKLIDDLAHAYTKEIGEREKWEKEAPGKYSQTYIEETVRNWKPKLDYTAKIGGLRQNHQKTAGELLDLIEREMDDFFSRPAKQEFVATLTAFKALDIFPSPKEFELLKSKSGSYLGLKLLLSLAGAKKKTVIGAEINENGGLDRTEKEITDPFITLDQLVTTDEAYNFFHQFKCAVLNALSDYCGVDAALRDFVFPPITEQSNYQEEYGIELPKRTVSVTSAIVRAKNAEHLFDRDSEEFTAFLDVMDELEGVFEPKQKTELTAGEIKLIDTIIDKNYPNTARQQAAEIAKQDGRLAKLLLLDPRYSDTVKEVLKQEEEKDKEKEKEEDAFAEIARKSGKRESEIQQRKLAAAKYYGLI